MKYKWLIYFSVPNQKSFVLFINIASGLYVKNKSMKKSNNSKQLNNEGKGKGKGTGFGFADAMFGIKDITAQYGDIESQEHKLEEYPLSQLLKPPTNKVSQNRATMIKKEPIQLKEQSVKIEKREVKQADVFKVNPGK